MIIQETIEEKLTAAFHPASLQVLNESDGHNVPAGSETHFKVIIISDTFSELSQVQRQQRVYKALREELANGVHALSMKTLTSEEWQQDSTIPESPPCLGGSKREGSKRKGDNQGNE